MTEPQDPGRNLRSLGHEQFPQEKKRLVFLKCPAVAVKRVRVCRDS